MPGFAPAGESLSLLTKKETERQNRKAILDSFSWPRRGEQLRCEQITPVSLRKPAKNQKFEAPPKLGKRYRRLPQTVGVLKPQTSDFYRIG
jgi:hypothetical protein